MRHKDQVFCPKEGAYQELCGCDWVQDRSCQCTLRSWVLLSRRCCGWRVCCRWHISIRWTLEAKFNSETMAELVDLHATAAIFSLIFLLFLMLLKIAHVLVFGRVPLALNRWRTAVCSVGHGVKAPSRVSTHTLRRISWGLFGFVEPWKVYLQIY